MEQENFNEYEGQDPEFNEVPSDDALSDDSVEVDPLVAIQAECDRLQNELEDAKDRALRTLAELENYRARTDRIQKEERKYASLDLARAILPVWDNLNLALAIKEPEQNVAAVLDGVKMVRDEFLRILEQNGVQKLDVLNKPFDPNFQESVAFVPSDLPANTVVGEIQAGFKLHERVVRAAKVALAAPKSN